MDWIYGQIVGFLGNFFALMGNMGVELFELEWVSAIILFFSRLAWALFAVSVVVCAFECGIEYSTGRGNLQQCGMNIIKGFLAVSLFTVVPVRLYALSVSLQGTFSAGLTGYGRSIGEVGQDIITELSEINQFELSRFAVLIWYRRKMQSNSLCSWIIRNGIAVFFWRTLSRTSEGDLANAPFPMPFLMFNGLCLSRGLFFYTDDVQIETS